MANPYHDSNGQFCSKGEMLDELKTLAEGNDFAKYYNLRKSYDEIEKAKATDITDLYVGGLPQDNPTLSMNTREEAIQSYDLVKDRLGDEVLNRNYTSWLLNSPNLPEDLRERVIADSTAYGLYDAIEKNDLSDTDYRNALKRSDAEEVYSVIAKNRDIPFYLRKEYLSNSVWGTSMLAIHNSKEFYADADLTNSLREIVKEGKDNKSVISALAESPYEEDHLTVIESKYANVGYPTPARFLASNPSISIETAKKLLESELRKETGTALTVGSELRKNAGISKNFNETSFKKFKYTNSSVTPEEKQRILTEIAQLEPEAEKSFVNAESMRAEFLDAKLYANDADFKELLKEGKRLVRKTKLTQAEKNRQYEVSFYFRRASSLRKSQELLSQLNNLTS